MRWEGWAGGHMMIRRLLLTWTDFFSSAVASCSSWCISRLRPSFNSRTRASCGGPGRRVVSNRCTVPPWRGRSTHPLLALPVLWRLGSNAAAAAATT